MVDGEVLERLWSYLRLFKKMTKEITASHREDILSDALFFLCQKAKIQNRYKGNFYDIRYMHVVVIVLFL